ncbi:ABSCISIC ACID-INSENSITIVE 5-like protein 2 isoform X1 [Eucalyptus grandis]|uniref:Uncharacterized protein n=2 Tax=Eucalyptus grandis TaxID=71139 RepID=A0ACC3J2F0_EUCGR|nr:ABSCISIC ACID-INSENSITIVE 5-like protein 2 isoform X1 [Eucalyptus grandis]KAK3408388.1 hypothetical protein EUGRSUZ_J00637 [Eucalyptus grandis]
MDRVGSGVPPSSSSSLQRQASSTLARALSGKTVEEVWKDIQQGQKKRSGSEVRSQGGDQTLSEMTLEDFLVQAGLFADAYLGPSMDLNLSELATPQSVTPPLGLSPAPSTGLLSDTSVPRRKRGDPVVYERTLERRLKRKIKNRESAARSRARKQAYQNELVSKVSHLEEENIKLKKEKISPSVKCFCMIRAKLCEAEFSSILLIFMIRWSCSGNLIHVSVYE